MTFKSLYFKYLICFALLLMLIKFFDFTGTHGSSVSLFSYVDKNLEGTSVDVVVEMLKLLSQFRNFCCSSTCNLKFLFSELHLID